MNIRFLTLFLFFVGCKEASQNSDNLGSGGSNVSSLSKDLACRKFLSYENKELEWAIFGANDKKELSGKIKIVKITPDGFFETAHSSGDNLPLTFYGGIIEDNKFVYINPETKIIWKGYCLSDKIMGITNSKVFEFYNPAKG